MTTSTAPGGSDDLPHLSRYDGPLAVRMNELGAYVLAHAPSFQPTAPDPVASSADRPVKVLPSHDVVVTGVLPTGGRLALEAFARQASGRVWTISHGASASAHRDRSPRRTA